MLHPTFDRIARQINSVMNHRIGPAPTLWMIQLFLLIGLIIAYIVYEPKSRYPGRSHDYQRTEDTKEYLVGYGSIIVRSGVEQEEYQSDPEAYVAEHGSLRYSGDTLFATTFTTGPFYDCIVPSIMFIDDVLHLESCQCGPQNICEGLEFYQFSYVVVRDRIRDYRVNMLLGR